jgi:hypothetical protein
VPQYNLLILDPAHVSNKPPAFFGLIIEHIIKDIKIFKSFNMLPY